MEIRGNTNSTQLAFEYSTSATLNDNNIKVLIEPNGEVGIGTRTPGTVHGASYGTTMLHIDGGTDRGQLIIEGDSFAGIVLSDNGTTANQRVFTTSVDDGKYSIKPLNDNGTSTANGIAVTVTHGGNVGIGTANPQQKFVVASATNGQGLEIVPGTTAILQTYDRNASAYIPFNIDTLSTNIRCINDFKVSTGSGFTERMRITSAGNVGIGDTPSFKLDVNVTSSRARFKATSGDANIELSSIAGHDWLIQSKSDSSLAIYDEDQTSERMRITSGGNILVGGSNDYSRISVTNGISTRTGITLSDGNTASLMLFAGNNSDAVIAIDTQNLSFKTGATVGQDNGTERMRITSAGNVGIGTTSPTNYKLEVNGTVEGSAFSVDGASSRIFAPAGATYNGSGTQTGYLIAKLPDNGASGINNMMTGVIRVFDYTFHESFDVHFAGYWYSGYNWTNCTAWIDSASYDDRNFTVRFGAMTGAAGAGTRPYITIAESASTWSYCKFSVINYEPGHSNYQAYKWDSGWNMDISATNPGVFAVTISNCQVNNWARIGQDLYYGSGTGNVGIGVTGPLSPLSIQANSGGGALRLIGRSDGISGIDFFNSTQTVSNYFQSNGTWIRLRADGGFHFSKGSTPITTDVDGFTIEGMNVGIGTTSPSAKLDIGGNTAGSVQATFGRGNSDNNFAVRYINGDAGTNNTIQGAIGLDYANGTWKDMASVKFIRDSTAGELAFYTSSSASNGTERMRIDSSGNVGITAAAYLGFNGSGDASHSVGYNTGIDGAILRGQNGVILGTGGGATATERMRINSQGQMWLGGSYTGSDIANGNTTYMNNLNAGSFSILHRNSSDVYVHFNSYYTSSNTYVSKYSGRGFMLGYNAAVDTGFIFSKAPNTTAGQKPNFFPSNGCRVWHI